MSTPLRVFFAVGLILSNAICDAQQEVVVITDSLFDNTLHRLALSEIEGWYFKAGNDTSWAAKEISLNGWKKMQPAQFNESYADENGKAEGWFRIKVVIDSKIKNPPSGTISHTWAASDVYINGTLATSFGQVGRDGYPFRENRYFRKEPVPITFTPGEVYAIAVHVGDYVAPLNWGSLKSSENIGRLLILATSQTPSIVQLFDERLLKQSVLLGITGIICILFWFFWLLNTREKSQILFALSCSFLSFWILIPLLEYSAKEISFQRFRVDDFLFVFCFVSGQLLVFMILKNVLNGKGDRRFNIVVYTILAIVLVTSLSVKLLSIAAVANILWVIACIFIAVKSWKKLKGAQWAIVIGLTLAIIFTVWSFIGIIFPSLTDWAQFLIYSIAIISFPFGLIIYAAIRFREINHETQVQANKVVQLSEEKKQQAINQQKILEEEVKRQTAELRNTLDNLKATQAQLIQSEKMASLGELTAGIAHEIQNPLNFVNNFSEVNKELLAEMNEEIGKGNLDEVKAIAKDVTENEEKINHHGKRADAIVKGMLQHSRSSSGQKELTDLNVLADEYLRLAYHGLRAKDNSLNATMKTDYDETIGAINIVPQDIGRVILNLFTNAFYAVTEKKKQIADGYEPTVSVSTKKINDKVQIRVTDNGNGIPQKALDKIFQPFFTTKPTGQGTGLGLSLSYDIVKAHGGEIKVKTKENDGTEFIISLPV